MKSWMMKISLLALIGCTSDREVASLREEIASLKKTIETIKPGLGLIMGTIQRHHEKLFFAAQNENWELAKFEIHEIEEFLEQGTELHEKIPKSDANLKELRKVTEDSIAQIEKGIAAKNQSEFQAGYTGLTQSCNQCHQSLGYGFISIQVPKTTIFTSQDFRPQPMSN